MKNIQHDFIAILKYKTPSEGGRHTPAIFGYRPGIKFGFTHMQTSGQQIFIDKKTVYPGENVKAFIKIVASEYFKHTLKEGMEFDFREGSTIIGTGKILTILNKDLISN